MPDFGLGALSSAHYRYGSMAKIGENGLRRLIIEQYRRLAGVPKALPQAVSGDCILLYISLYNLRPTVRPLFFLCGQVQAAWTPPVTINMGQKIFATIILVAEFFLKCEFYGEKTS
jgi:hypothetical protein